MRQWPPTAALPGAISPATVRSSLCGACGGRYCSRPSSRKRLGAAGSKPLSSRATGQLAASLRSAATAVRVQRHGSARRATAAFLYAMAAGTSSSKTRTLSERRGSRHARASRPAPRMTNWRTPSSSAAIQRASSQRVRSTSPKMVSSGRKPSGEAIASSISAPVSPASSCAARSGPPPTLVPICGAAERASQARIAAAHCAVGKAASGCGAASGSAAVAPRVQVCSRYASNSDTAAVKQQRRSGAPNMESAVLASVQRWYSKNNAGVTKRLRALA